jgi:quinoprotein glucose dehydrogenase
VHPFDAKLEMSFSVIGKAADVVKTKSHGMSKILVDGSLNLALVEAIIYLPTLDPRSFLSFSIVFNLPASNPPWGYIAKLDLTTGKLLYKSPIGYLNIDNKKEKVGTTIYGGLSINKGNVIFANGTEDGLAYALDAETGKELWNFQMNASGSTPPIIFMHNNRQYVSFLSSGGNYHNYKDRSSTLYTFTILK